MTRCIDLTRILEDDEPAPTLANRVAIHRMYDGFQSAIIDRIAHDSGFSREVVLEILDTPLTAPEGAWVQ